MEIVATFNPITTINGEIIVPGFNPGTKLLFVNKSYVDLRFTFSNGHNLTVPANDRRLYCASGQGAIPNPIVNWQQVVIDYPQTALQLDNTVYVELFQPGEQVNETYPASIARQPVPNIIPYSIGYGTFHKSLTPGGVSVSKVAIWPSSYHGITVAPTNIGGQGFDHFWPYYRLGNPTMLDLPGFYGFATSKTENDATSAGAITMVPGPFSYNGLTANDTANFLNPGYFTTTLSIDFASIAATGWFIDGWINFASYPSHNTMMIADEYPPVSSKGFSFYVDIQGFIQVWQAFTGGNVAIQSNIPINKGQWVYWAVLYTGSGSTNTFSLYINGNLIQSLTPSGTPVNSALNVNIGRNPNVLDPGMIGSIANTGILLSQPQFWGPLGRWLIGQQALTVDFQNAWIDQINLTYNTSAATAATLFGVSSTALFNPAGLLGVQTPAAATTLHPYARAVSGIPFNSICPALGANAVYKDLTTFTNKLSHFYDNWPVLATSWVTTTPSVGIQVSGYNILGLA